MDNKTVILVCGNFRGLAQPIRYLLYYLRVDFQEIHLKLCGGIEQESAKLPNKIQLDPCQMPYLLHEGLVINEIFPIVFYLCQRFERTDLLGRTLEEKVKNKAIQAHVHEVLEKYTRKRSIKYQIILKMMVEISKNPEKVK